MTALVDTLSEQFEGKSDVIPSQRVPAIIGLGKQANISD